MAYFPNGMSCEVYEEKWCAHCRHGAHGADEDGCPVMVLHLVNNYAALDNELLKDALDFLIPMDGLEAQKCRMFLAWDEERCDKTEDLFK